MLSIIICSRTSDISSEMRENFPNAIGTEYEWVIIDNSKLDYSIFLAYNMGVKKASGDICCFIHDVILFHSNG